MLCDGFQSGIDNIIIVSIRFRWRELAELNNWHDCGVDAKVVSKTRRLIRIEAQSGSLDLEA